MRLSIIKSWPPIGWSARYAILDLLTTSMTSLVTDVTDDSAVLSNFTRSHYFKTSNKLHNWAYSPQTLSPQKGFMAEKTRSRRQAGRRVCRTGGRTHAHTDTQHENIMPPRFTDWRRRPKNSQLNHQLHFRVILNSRLKIKPHAGQRPTFSPPGCATGRLRPSSTVLN